MKVESKALIEASTLKGGVVIPRSFYAEARWSYSDIEHYFDANRNELGYISFPGTEYEYVIRFNPPRKWSPKFLDALQWETLVK